jgi:hypothetical protein
MHKRPERKDKRIAHTGTVRTGGPDPIVDEFLACCRRARCNNPRRKHICWMLYSDDDDDKDDEDDAAVISVSLSQLQKWGQVFPCESIRRSEALKKSQRGYWILNAMVSMVAADEGHTNVVTWLSASCMGRRYLWGANASMAFAAARVKELDLSHNRLDRLPKHLALLTELRRLQLDANQLGSLPNALSRLTNLQTLILDDNPLGGTIPSCVYRMTALRWLSARSTQITVLHPAIHRLQELRWLYLSHNLLESVPVEVCCLTKLERLYLKRNPRMTCLPDGIWTHPKLHNVTAPMGWDQVIFPASILEAKNPLLCDGWMSFANPAGTAHTPRLRSSTWATRRCFRGNNPRLLKRTCLPSDLLSSLTVPSLYQLCQARVHEMACCL